MLSSLSRLLLASQNPCFRQTAKFIHMPTPMTRGRHGCDQIEYAKSVISGSNSFEWETIKKNTLEIPGSINIKNIDAVLLKVMVNCKNFDAALSYANYLKGSKELNIGAINALLVLYYEIGKTGELSEEQKTFILETYKDLYNKYKVLDATTCERLLHALCVINEWKKALKVLDDNKQSSTPTHSSYSTIIATLFKLNKRTDALKLIQRSILDSRPLHHEAYSAWIEYVLRKYKEKKTILKHLEEISMHIMNNSVTVKEITANLIQNTYHKLDWDAKFTKIRKKDGLCISCQQKLDCLKPSNEEFQLLQDSVKEKLIIGSDLFLKTSPDELERFLKYFQQTAPYDIVLDALNIAYVARKGSINRVGILNNVVDHFKKQNKKILLLGRKHMLHWPRKQMQEIMRKTCCFFTDDLSQDDPFFITASILSGSHTDFVSKDLLRGHKFLMKDEKLRLIFRRWQWEHQWMVFINRSAKVIIHPPLSFTPSPQTKNGVWHLPFEKEEETSTGQVNDGTPDLTSWLCLKPKTSPKQVETVLN